MDEVAVESFESVLPNTEIERFVVADERSLVGFLDVLDMEFYARTNFLKIEIENSAIGSSNEIYSTYISVCSVSISTPRIG